MRFLCTFFNILCMKKKKIMRKIAILASGEGTNAEHIIQYFAGHPAIQVVVVIASKPTAGVIKRAESLNVPVEVLSKEVFEKGTVLEVLSRYAADFIVLAGFLLHIPSAVLHDYSGKIVNIHPSLLPKFGGKGMYGGHVHEAVLAAKEKESGITVHYVDELYDNGKIIFQAKCPVFPEDTPELLAQRVHALEYTYYPCVIEKVLLGEDSYSCRKA